MVGRYHRVDTPSPSRGPGPHRQVGMTALHIELRLPDRPPGPALVLAADARGLRLAALPAAGSPPRAGDRAEVVLSAGAVRHCTAVHVSRVRHGDPGDELDLRWVHPERLRTALPGAVAEALRQATRRRGHLARAEVRLPTGWAGTLEDLCDTDLGIAVPATAAPPVGADLLVRLHLPGARAPLEATATVQAHHGTGPRRRLALAFSGPEAARLRLADAIRAALLLRRTRGVSLAS